MTETRMEWAYLQKRRYLRFWRLFAMAGERMTRALHVAAEISCNRAPPPAPTFSL
jgi:hypothetical protein